MWNLDLVNDYLKYGKESPVFKKIYELSFDLFPFRIDGISITREQKRYIPIKGQPQSWKVLQRPRPVHKDPVEWMIENWDMAFQD